MFIEIISWVDLFMIFSSMSEDIISDHFVYMTYLWKENNSGNYFVVSCT